MHILIENGNAANVHKRATDINQQEQWIVYRHNKRRRRRKDEICFVFDLMWIVDCELWIYKYIYLFDAEIDRQHEIHNQYYKATKWTYKHLHIELI